MAAFINALFEEGSLTECRHWVDKMRDENKKFYNTALSDEMTRDECFTEISELWNWECVSRRNNST